MSYNLKKKKSAISTHKAVRTNLKLNGSNEIQILNINCYLSENTIWTKSWLEQSEEMRSNCEITIQDPSRKLKLIMKWWEN